MNITCSNPDCRVNETGKCVEGFEIGECRHVIRKSEVIKEGDISLDHDDSDEGEDIESKKAESDVSIHSGEKLSIYEAVSVLLSHRSEVVAIVGPSNSGKTTFSLSIYNNLVNGDFCEWYFAGSKTLKEFEMSSFHSRVESGRKKPETEHTSASSGMHFMHLALYNDIDGKMNLLISDRSGEYYSNISASIEDAEKAYEISRADTILFFMDGEKIITREIHALKQDLRLLIGSFLMSSINFKNKHIGIVLSKYDCVALSGKMKEIDDYFDKMIQELITEFGGCFQSIKAYRIAARPSSTGFKKGYGLDNVFIDCVSKKKLVEENNYVHVKSERAFLNIGWDS